MGAPVAYFRCERGNDSDDEGFEAGGCGADDGEVDFDGGPVGCGAAVPCHVHGVIGDFDEEPKADN